MLGPLQISRETARIFLQIGKFSYAHMAVNKSPTVCVPLDAAKDFIKSCITAAGASESHADDLAEVLVAADNRGHFSHGLNRLEMYVTDLQTKNTSAEGEPKVINETPATALVDGNNLLGPAVGKFCMNLAIKKAKEVGVGWVAARRSNHYSIAGYYGLMAAKEGLIGFSFTNTTPIVYPCRARTCTLGTNPICCAAPAAGGDPFVLDMATTTVSSGKVELADRKNEPIPNGWGADQSGRETNDPCEVLNGGGLLPLGGSEQSGGYKGYGLAMMVEVLCGILAGAQYGPNIRKWGNTERIADLGQCFIALSPGAFCPGFEARMQDLIDTQRALNPTEPDKPVVVAGDPERNHIKKCEELGGIPYPRNVVEYMNGVGAKLSVPNMKTLESAKSS